ncbi:hypothetical protein [Streptomyces sp. NBC_01174]|uniref:hypothetical protein n=1 Tax=Streptomyces sp. NBC_01174 TaxID=2903758 RepID=UPI003870B907
MALVVDSATSDFSTQGPVDLEEHLPFTSHDQADAEPILGLGKDCGHIRIIVD